MRQIDFGINNYERKDELKSFVDSVNNAFNRYTNSSKNADSGLKKIEKEIESKEKTIFNLDTEIDNLNKKESELTELKNATLGSIKEYEAKKKNIDFEDNEVKKMEIDDIDTLITSKKSKIQTIDGKLDTTKVKIKEIKENKKVNETDLNVLEESKKVTESSLRRTENILELVHRLQEELNESIIDILEEKNIEYKVKEVEKVVVPKVEPEKKPKVEEKEDNKLDFKFDDITPVNKKKEVIFEKEEPVIDYNELLEDLFNKEVINFNDFSINVREKMLKKSDNVIKNLSILKKHKIPLELTLSQNNIYYDILPQDLEDLLNIITSDDDGNGMGFSIEFTYYILGELAKTNVDTLIDVYNNEFMNINSKSGIIELLKKAGLSKEKFNTNRQANVDTLRVLGIKNIKDIKSKYPEFIDMDNPLFIEALNLFDKDDLIEKITTDINIIPKIIEYWENN